MVGDAATAAYIAFINDDAVRGKLQDTSPLHGHDLVVMSQRFEAHVAGIVARTEPTPALSDLVSKRERMRNVFQDLYWVDLVLAGER